MEWLKILNSTNFLTLPLYHIRPLKFLSEVGTRTFFWSPQSQFRNVKEALPQLFKEMLLRNRNSAVAIFSEVRNLRASLPQFSAYFWL
jgi:hypothetical protein